MDSKWFYQADGRTCGPVSRASLRRLAQEGRLGRRQTIWPASGGERVPAESVPGIFGGEVEEREGALETIGSLDELGIFVKGAPAIESVGAVSQASTLPPLPEETTAPAPPAGDDSSFASLGFTAADLDALEAAPAGGHASSSASVPDVRNAARQRPSAGRDVDDPAGEASDALPDIERFGLELVARGDRGRGEPAEGLATPETLDELLGGGRRSSATAQGEFDLRRPGASPGRPRVIGQSAEKSGGTVVRGARSATAAVRSGADWYWRRGDSIEGPTTLRELRSRLERREISANDEVRHGVHGLWVSAATLTPTAVPVETVAASPPAASAAALAPSPSAAKGAPAASPGDPSAPAPSLFDQARSAGTVWCCWIDGTEYGPLTCDQLVQWIVEGRVLEEDPLRRADSTQWFPASNLAGLFEHARAVEAEMQASIHDAFESGGTPSSESTITGSSVLDSVVAQAAPGVTDASKSGAHKAAASQSGVHRASPAADSSTPAGRSGVQKSGPGTPAAAGAGSAVPAADSRAFRKFEMEPDDEPVPTVAPERTSERLAASHGQAAADELRRRLGLDEPSESARYAREAAGNVWESFKGQVAEKPWLYSIALVLALLVGGSYGWQALRLRFVDGHDREDYKLVVELWTQFRNLRQSKPDEARWKELENITNEKLAPVVARLEKTASAKAPQRQQLLHAAKSYLPRMFGDSREKPGPNETELANAVSNAGKIIFDQNRRR